MDQQPAKQLRNFRLHVIPRYHGDVPDPRGGVRFVIPHKAKYWP